MSKDYLSVKELANLLGYNPKKIYELIKKGKLPATQITGKYIIPRKTLEGFMDRKANDEMCWRITMNLGLDKSGEPNREARPKKAK